MVVKIMISVALGCMMIYSMGVYCSGKIADKETGKIVLSYAILNFIVFCICVTGLYFLWLLDK